MILLFVVVGWGPLFLADLGRSVRPDLNASYRPQAFAMGWMMITLYCSLLAVACTIGHAVRLVLAAGRRSARGRDPRKGGPT
jgi:hypothetical protein